MKEVKQEKRYISHDPSTGEVHLDKFNIDFIRYFKLQNFIFALVGSLIGFFIWTEIAILFEYTLILDISVMYMLFIFGAIAWFIFCAAICYFAGNKKHEAARLAGRRGLFTFTVMLVVVITCLIITGKVSLHQQFYYFLKYLMTGMIIEGIFVLPLDYGISFIQGFFRKRLFDLV